MTECKSYTIIHKLNGQGHLNLKTILNLPNLKKYLIMFKSNVYNGENYACH